MTEPNITLSDQTHKIFISSPTPVSDHTGLYIILLLLLLTFILVFYLIYNLISFKHYSLSQKNKKKSSIYSTEQLHEHVSINLSQTTKPKIKERTHSYEELRNSSHRIPSQTTTSLLIHENIRQANKNFIRDPYKINTNRLVSDL